MLTLTLRGLERDGLVTRTNWVRKNRLAIEQAQKRSDAEHVASRTCGATHAASHRSRAARECMDRNDRAVFVTLGFNLDRFGSGSTN
jgi:hypothetical protein